MNKLILAISAVLTLGITQIGTAQETEKQFVIENRHNSPESVDKPYVILISLDGFRHDYIDMYDAKFLKKIAGKGVKAESMIPSYPSVTFPNHYTIVTGLYPAHHGLVGNNILDTTTGDRYSLKNHKAVTNPKWYGGTPLWVLAEQQGMLSACYYWPGSEAPIKDKYPSYYYGYSEKASVNERVNEVTKWLELPAEKRPHFITFYMPEVDHAGHSFGPESKETKEAVEYVDKAMEKLFNTINKTGLPVNFIIVSDHGMLALDQEVQLQLPLKIDDKALSVVSNGTYVSVFVKNKKDINSWYEKFKKAADPKLMQVFQHDSLPEHYNFGGQDDRFDRVGDIVLTAQPPYYFSNHKLPGSHGFDPTLVKEMHAIFIAYGPNIKENMTIPSFENVNVYPIITDILKLETDENLDGNHDISREILK